MAEETPTSAATEDPSASAGGSEGCTTATTKAKQILDCLTTENVLKDIVDVSDLDTSLNNPLYAPIPEPRAIEDLTTVPTPKAIKGTELDATDSSGNPINIPGTGDLDKLSKALSNQLEAIQQGFGLDNAGKAAVLAQALPAVMNIAVQYNLNKDVTRWDSVSAQFRARESEIRAKTAEYELTIARNEAESKRIDAARAIIELAVVDKQHEISCEKLLQERKNTEIITSKLAQEIKQETVIDRQITQIESATKLTDAQIAGVKYGYSDSVNSVVAGGTVRRQNTLLDKQTQAYELDGKQKFARLFIDRFAIDKSADSGIQAPNNIGNDATQFVMDELARSLGLITGTPVPKSALPVTQ